MPIKNDVYVGDNIFSFKFRLLVPTSLLKYMLSLLHESFGMFKMGKRARKTCYGSSIDELISLSIPHKPLSEIAADVFEFEKLDYLLISDILRNALEGFPHFIFLPDTIFLKSKYLMLHSHHIKRKKNAEDYNKYIKFPFHPKSNEFAESSMKMARNILRKEGDFISAIFNYNVTSIEGVGLSPAQMTMNRCLKSRILVNDYVKKQNKYPSSNVKNGICGKNIFKEVLGWDLLKKKRIREWAKYKNKKANSGTPGVVIKIVDTSPSYIMKYQTCTNYRRNNIYGKIWTIQ